MTQVASIIATSAPALNPDVTAPPSRWDRLGIFASLGCAVHCLAAPFLLLLLPSLGSVWAHPAAHWILAALVLPLAGIVISRGFRTHRKRSALVAAGLGGALIVAGLILPELPAASTAAGGEVVQVSHAAGPGEPSGAASACTDASCCPSLIHDAETGNVVAMTIPPAGVVTLVGSVLLAIAHGINLWGCRCVLRRTEDDAGTCGCPASSLKPA